MSQGQEKTVQNRDPETEEEYLTDSDVEDGRHDDGVAPVGGTAMVATISSKGGTKPKLWLAAVDRKFYKIDRVMERVAYWPNKPPTLSQLEAARDARMEKEADRLARVAQRKEEQGVSVYLCYDRNRFVMLCVNFCGGRNVLLP